MTHESASVHHTPYVGVRAYGADDVDLFAGRDADVASVADLVADKDRWRLILLHGMTGAGKSSFLKAGLIPEVTSSSIGTVVYERHEGDKSYSFFITSTDDPMSRLAEAVLQLVQDTIPDEEIEEFLAEIGLTSTVEHEQEQATLARSAQQLANLFAALAPRLKRPLLLIIDQAEELFTIRDGKDAEDARECYFAFLAEFCSKSSWIQLLLSMRTEFYGRFDAELRRYLGPSITVAPYFLKSLSAPILAQVILAPCAFSFRTESGRSYTIRYEADLPERIAHDLVRLFPGPGALTCMQIICGQLAERAVKNCFDEQHDAHMEPANREVYIRTAMYCDMGSTTHAIEDVIDQALSSFCDAKGLVVFDAIVIWRACKKMLGSLVVQQAEGAPSTAFMLRERFVDDLSKLIDYRILSVNERIFTFFFHATYKFGRSRQARPFWRIPGRMWIDFKPLAEALVDHLLTPEARILRTVQVIKGSAPPRYFIALGHDVLAVGIAEYNARTDWLAEKRKEEVKRLIRLQFWIPFFSGLAVAIALALGTLLELNHAALHEILVSALVIVFTSFYLMTFYTFVRGVNRRAGGTSYDRIDTFIHEDSSVRPRINSIWTTLRLRLVMVSGLLITFYRNGLLFRSMTAQDRQQHATAGHSAFPGGPRY